MVFSVLTSPTGRILDVFYILPEQLLGDQGVNESIAVLTLPGRKDQTARFLKSRIFFNDNVAVIDQTEMFFQIDFSGPHAGQLLQELTGQEPPDHGEISEMAIAGHQTYLIGHNSELASGWRVIAPSSAVDETAQALEQAGAVCLTGNTMQILRVETGLPGAANELIDDYTPLEMNLREAISDNKGCYTGQEVIARQINYDKITKTLTGLFIENSRGSNLVLEARSPVKSGDNLVGAVTSAVESPRYGLIALAVIRQQHSKPGTRLIVQSGDQDFQAVVTKLPFTK
jgi:tRNA-modifying protein YgfZ